MKEVFRKTAAKISNVAGSAYAFLLAISVIIIWAVSGSAFHYSDTWQLVINTGTTIITFLMVFLIQNTQNRDSKALHLKLDELLRSSKSARKAFIDLENFSDEDLNLLDRESREMHEELQDNPSLMKLRKKIDEEKSRRGLRGAGAAIKTILNKEIPGTKNLNITPKND